jgi:hypothetical protein
MSAAMNLHLVVTASFSLDAAEMISKLGRGTQNDLRDFHKYITAAEQNAGLTHTLAGLWWDAKGDWKGIEGIDKTTPKR